MSNKSISVNEVKKLVKENLNRFSTEKVVETDTFSINNGCFHYITFDGKFLDQWVYTSYVAINCVEFYKLVTGIDTESWHFTNKAIEFVENSLNEINDKIRIK
jgi:hypothetical protein